MIPKVIHYCWFGQKPKPQKVLDCIDTWKSIVPDYQIKEWNENNFDVNCMKFTKEAYALKQFAFVSDVVRLYALYTEGGIYLDTDIEVRKELTPLLHNKSFIGWEDILLGTGVLASISHANWLNDCLNIYKHNGFISWFGKLRNTPNPYLLSQVLQDYGLKLNHEKDLLEDDIAIYPIEYLCAHNMKERRYVITENTYCIHHFDSSWCNKGRRLNLLDKLCNIPRFICVKIKIAFVKSVMELDI